MKLWINASYISNAPDFTVPATAGELAGPVPSSDFYEFGDWIIVRYLFYIIPRVYSIFPEITDGLLMILE